MSELAANIGPAHGAAKRSFGSAPRWVKAALLGSLAVNLLVLGLGAGALWQLRTGQMAGGGNLHSNLMAFSQTLPANRRAELDALVGDQRQQPELQLQRQDVRIARREVMRLFRADPLDVQVFRAAEVRAAAAEARLRDSTDLLALSVAL
jgi:uncharacterized membrane protein